MTEIRPLEREDCAAAAEIEAESLHEAWSQSAIASLCGKADAAVLAAYERAESGSEPSLVGLVHCEFVLDEAHISSVAVTQSRRRRGIGEKLMLALFEEAKKRGCCVIFLDVRKSNTAAVALYKKLGFTVLGEQAGAYRTVEGGKIVGRENALVMGKKLI